MTDNSGANGTSDMHASIIERIRLATDRHGMLLEEHTGTLKEIRAHLYKLDDIATNTGKLANSVDGALGRVFTMLEKREDGSRKGSLITTSVLGLLLVILGLAVTKLQLSAAIQDSNITIQDQSYAPRNKEPGN